MARSDWTVVLYMLLAVLTLARFADSAEDQRNDLVSMLQDGRKESKEPVSVMWGLSDVTVAVGTVFQYRMPKDAFSGTTSSYQITEMGTNALPPWLHYDDLLETLEGVPGNDDIGRTYYIEVTAVSKFSNDSKASDVFSIRVTDFSAYTSDVVPVQDSDAPIKCISGSAVTTATVIVDVDLDLLKPVERVATVEGLCEHLGLALSAVRLLSPGAQPLFDSSALVAGPGDVARAVHSGALLQWEVGCGSVQTQHLAMLQKVEATAQNGTMTQVIGHGIVGWHVTNKKPTSMLRRLKRRVQKFAPTPTPTMIATPPTGKPSPTRVVTDVIPTRVKPLKTSSAPPTEKPKPTKPEKRKKYRLRLCVDTMLCVHG